MGRGLPDLAYRCLTILRLIDNRLSMDSRISRLKRIRSCLTALSRIRGERQLLDEPFSLYGKGQAGTTVLAAIKTWEKCTIKIGEKCTIFVHIEPIPKILKRPP
jgi:hypothetical protein